MNVTERFLKYVKFDTQSDELTNLTPSTPGQYKFAQALEKELQQMGLEDVTLDENGYLMATLPANVDREVPVVGFIAHLDTSPDLSGHNVNPRIVENYDGGDITLNPEKGIVLSPGQFPELLHYKGQDLIVTDGTTLLGADDKAGIAEILTAAERLLASPEPHATLRIGFTPDEEVGSGADNFNVAEFGADFAYTVDGGAEGEIEYENFNAAAAKIVVNGFNIHPGDSKNKMINALLVAMELNSMLPDETPANTEGYEGFFHLTDMSGNVERAEMDYIIRDHSEAIMTARKATLVHAVKILNEKYGSGTVECTVRDQYLNMVEKIRPCMHLIDNAVEAAKSIGLVPKVAPIRGGTDGARLSFMGLPCPNLGTGDFACHGPYEHVTVEGMEKCTELVLLLIDKYSKAAK